MNSWRKTRENMERGQSFDEARTGTEPQIEGPIFIGTMQGVETYLERLDRTAFLAMHNAFAQEFNSLTLKRYVLDRLQDEWANIGDAWRIAQKLVD